MYGVLELLEVSKQAQDACSRLHQLLDREILRDSDDDEYPEDRVLQRTKDCQELLATSEPTFASCVVWCKSKLAEDGKTRALVVAGSKEKWEKGPNIPGLTDSLEQVVADALFVLRRLHQRVLHTLAVNYDTHGATRQVQYVMDMENAAGSIQWSGSRLEEQKLAARDLFYRYCVDAGVPDIPYNGWNTLPPEVLATIRCQWLHYNALIVATSTLCARDGVFVCPVDENEVFQDGDEAAVVAKCKAFTEAKVGSIGSFYVQEGSARNFNYEKMCSY